MTRDRLLLSLISISLFRTCYCWPALVAIMANTLVSITADVTGIQLPVTPENDKCCSYLRFLYYVLLNCSEHVELLSETLAYSDNL